MNASAACWETTATLPGACAGSGTRFCNTPTSGVLYAGLIPFVTLAVIALLLVTYIPAISLVIMRALV